MRDEDGEIVLVNVRGKPLLPKRSTGNSSRRTLQTLLESTVSIAIVTAVMFYLGHVYYQNFFGSFGGPLTFPSVGTNDYLTKAFDLATTSFVQILVLIWLATFVVLLEVDELISRVQIVTNVITEQNRVIGSQEWELRRISREKRRLLKNLRSSNHASYVSYVSENPGIEISHKMNWSHWLLRIFPYHVTWRGALGGITLNLYILLTIVLMVVTAIRLDAMDTDRWIIAGMVATFPLIASLLGKSIFHVVRSRMKSELFARLYFAFVAFLIIVFTAEFFAGSLGRYDARQFMEGHGAGSYLTIFDVRGDRPDLERMTFRVVIQREGDYYVVPSDQTDIERATLVVIPKSEIISQTTEAVEP